jgi:DNA-binding SARP family transcriptional activator
VVIPADDMITLLGADAVTIGTWPRLRVTPDLDTALKILEARLLGATRLLDEHDATDLAALRSTDSTAPPLPPMLLVTAAPPPQQSERLRVVLGLGQALDVTAVLLGEWQHGPTVTVDPDGTCHPTRAGGDTPARLTVLDTAAAEEMLRTLREAHTGEPAQPVPTAAIRTHNEKGVPAAAETTATAEKANDGQAHVPAQPQPPDEARPSIQDGGDEAAESRARVRVRVLGPPTIANRPETVRLRAYAVELLVYLAVRTDGATADEIMEAMWPDTRRAPASQRLHQAISNLRQNLAGALPGGDDIARPDPVIRVNGRWRLKPDVVEVDLWQLRAAHTAAKATSGQERIDALARAAAAYGGALAGDYDYPWADRHRQGVLNLAIDAHTALATALADTDPDQALRLLQAAAELDPLNEDVARELMRAQHRAGDLGAVRATLRRLRLALDEIGTEPGPETLGLADNLRRDPSGRPGSVTST